MEVKKHIRRWAVILSVLALVCTATGRLLFASADTRNPSSSNYFSVTPTSSAVFYARSFESVTPTSTAVRMAQSVTPTSSHVPTTTINRVYRPGEYTSDGIQVLSTTPTSTRPIILLSTNQEQESQKEAKEPVYTVQPVYQEEPALTPAVVAPVQDAVFSQVLPTHRERVPVELMVSTEVTDETVLDGFIYTVNFVSSSGASSAIPEMPHDNTVAVAGSDIDSFNAIYFKEPGKYYFKVEQDRINNALNLDKGYEWNDTWYFVEVCIEKGQSGLTSNVTYYEVASGGNCIPKGLFATFTQVRK